MIQEFALGGTHDLPMLYRPESTSTALHGFFGKPAAGLFPAASDKNHEEVFFAPGNIAGYYRDSGAEMYGDHFPKECAHTKQVHYDNVIIIPDQECNILPHGRTPDDVADGLVTDKPGIALTVKTADCLPVLMYTEDGQVVGSCHAGWKGACRGIAERTLAALLSLHNHHPGQARILIGPCIRPPSFEVQENFITEAAALGVEPQHYIREISSDNAQNKQCFFDIPALVRDRLNAAGVPDHHIYDCGVDTYPPGSGYFSYRRMSQQHTPYVFHNYAWISKP